MPYFRHLMESLLNPYFLILLTFALLILRLYLKEVSRVLVWGFILSLSALIILSQAWLPQLLTKDLENQYPVVVHPNPEIEWVVVFSGGQFNDSGKPENMLLSAASIKRLIEGVRLYRQLPRAKLLLSGGGYEQEVPEANRLATLSHWFDIPQTRIVLETASINTADQAKEIKQWVGAKPFYLVTSAIHMHRAMRLCQAQALHPIAAPTDFSLFWQDERWEKRYLPNPYNLVYLSIALHEIMGMGWSKLVGDFRGQMK